METLLQDIRFGVRMLIKQPGFAFIATLTIALGIGANTAIFSVVNSILLRPLHFNEPEQLTGIFETVAGRRSYMSYPNFQDYREQNAVFEDMAGFASQSVNLTGMEQPDRVRGGFVTASFFKVLDAQPALGRAFNPGEDKLGGERVAVVNYGAWKNRFGADPNFVGKTLTLNGEPFTVVGIMPEDFSFPIDEIEVWLPLQYYPNFKPLRGVPSCFAIGRLKKGVDLSQAQTELGVIAKRLSESYPEENKGHVIEIGSLHELVVERMRPALLVLMSAVGFILLIACANIANILLARGSARYKEMAVRAALGAGRVRLLRQLLTETLLISLAGGILGLLLALWGTDLLLALNPNNLPNGVSVRADLNVLLFTLTISILTGILFGFAPALQLSKPDLIASLKDGRSTSEGGRRRLRSILVVTQVALSLVLLVGAGLLIKSFYRLLHVDPGFKPEKLLTMEYRLPRNKYQEEKQQWEFHRQVVERIRAVPGVESAALVGGLPMSGNGGSINFILPDRSLPAKGEEPSAGFNTATPGYFETIGIPIIKGRVFNQQDTPDSPQVVVINRTMAQLYWPNEDPIGKQVQFPKQPGISEPINITVIGVVGDAKQYQLSEKIRPQVYVCYSQNPDIFATIVARTAQDPMTLSKAVREAVWSVDKDQPMWKIRTLEYLLERNVASDRFMMVLMGAFAALALLLTGLGLYGVISYSVGRRTQEIGLRMALGAQPGDVLKLILSQGMAMTLAGIAIGLAVAVAATRFIAGLLYDVGTTDPATFVLVSMLLAAVAALACYIPARRATKVDPMVALRYE